MAISIPRIDYADKVDFQQQGQDEKYKITAKNMNDIKKTFNQSASVIEQAVNDLEANVTKTTTSMNNAKQSETNAKSYMESAQASANSVLDGLGLKMVNGYLCTRRG